MIRILAMCVIIAISSANALAAWPGITVERYKGKMYWTDEDGYRWSAKSKNIRDGSVIHRIWRYKNGRVFRIYPGYRNDYRRGFGGVS